MNFFRNNDIDYDGNPLETEADILTEDDFIYKVDQLELRQLKEIIQKAECFMQEDDYKLSNEILNKYIIE